MGARSCEAAKLLSEAGFVKAMLDVILITCAKGGYQTMQKSGEPGVKNRRYRQIWETVQAIPPGRVASYGQIADLAGLPGRARLVGKSLGCVPEAMEVPWQRVLRSDGRLAFAAGSTAAERQQALLQTEGVAVLANRVDMTAFRWQPTSDELLLKLRF